MNKLDKRLLRLVPLVGVVVGLVLAPSGCGQTGPGRYVLSGTVTYEGKPVPVGEIHLAPDTSKGNSGPGTIALIKDGQYRTQPNRGIVGGPYIVTILGFDGVPVGDSEAGSELFPPYRVEVEFPKQSTVYNFEVPSARAQKP